MKNYKTMKRFITTTITILVALFALTPTFAATFTVTTTADSGAGSLRQAITDANASGGVDIIEFNIGGVGPHTIALTTRLPDISEGVTMDGGGDIVIQVGRPILRLRNAHDSTITGLDLSNPNSCTFGDGIGMDIYNSNNLVLDNIDVNNKGYGIHITGGENVTVKNCDFTNSGCSNVGDALRLNGTTMFKGFGNVWTDHRAIRLTNLTNFLVTDAVPATGDHYLVVESTGGTSMAAGTMYVTNVDNSTFENFDYSKGTPVCGGGRGLEFRSCENLMVDGVNLSGKGYGIYFQDCDEVDLINSDMSNSGCGNVGHALSVNNTTNFRGSGNTYTDHKALRLTNLTDFLVTDAMPAAGINHYLVLEPTSGAGDTKTATMYVHNVHNSIFENFDYSKNSPCTFGGSGAGLQFYNCNDLLVDGVSVKSKGYGIYVRDSDNVTVINSNFDNSGCSNVGYSLYFNNVTNIKAYDNSFYGNARRILMDKVHDMLITGVMPVGLDHFMVLKPEDGIEALGSYVLELFGCKKMVIDGVDFTKQTPNILGQGIKIQKAAQSGDYTIKNCIFENIHIPIFYQSDDPLSVTCSLFKGNNFGMMLFSYLPATLEIKDNSFACNMVRAIQNSTGEPIVAEDNYWGDSSGPLNDGGTGERYLGVIDVLPFSTTPPTCAPASAANAITITASDLDVCPGESVTLDAGTQSNYLWSNSASTQMITVTPTANTIYSVEVTDSKGCRANAAIEISVQDALSFDTDNATQFTTPLGMQIYSVDVCGDLTGFSHNMISSGGISSIQFLPSANAGCQKAQVSYANSVNWTLEVETAGGCISTVGSNDVVSVSGVPLLVLDGINVIKDESCIGKKDGELNVQVSGGDLSCGNYTYSWTGPGGFTATTQTITGLGKGSYQVTVTDCAGTSILGAQLVRVVNGGGRGGRGGGGCKTAVETLLSDFRLQPNPAHDYVQVYFETTTENDQQFQVSLLDLAGRVLQQVETDADGMMHLDLNTVIDGLYIVQIQSNGQILEQAKLVVVR